MAMELQMVIFLFNFRMHKLCLEFLIHYSEQIAVLLLMYNLLFPKSMTFIKFESNTYLNSSICAIFL